MPKNKSNEQPQIVGWVYKFKIGEKWELWNAPEKPTHINDLSQCSFMCMEPVYKSSFSSVNHLDSSDYTNVTDFCAAFNKKPAETVVHTTADMLQCMYKENQAEIADVLKDCVKYIKISESHEKSLRELQNSIYEIIGYDGETDVLRLNDDKKIEGAEAKELISRLKKIAKDVNEHIDAVRKAPDVNVTRLKSSDFENTDDFLDAVRKSPDDVVITTSSDVIKKIYQDLEEHNKEQIDIMIALHGIA